MIITTKTDQRNEQIKDYWRRFHAEKQALYKKQIIKGCIIAPFIFLLPYIFAILLVLISGKSFATGLVDLKFGSAQIADSQWNVQSCTQTATCQIYSKNPGTAYKIPWWSGQLTWASGDYVAFVATGDATNPWNAIQYNANGTQKAVMGTGHIINMGADYFFFVGNDNDTGQLFSMTSGFANTSGVTWTGTLNPTVTQVNTYAQGGSTTVLTAGQTVTPSAPVRTVTGTAVTYTTRNVVSGNTTTVYRTPVTTTTYSDGTSTSSNGTETLYQTRVASNVVTTKIVNGVLTTTTTPINKVTTGGMTIVETNGNANITTQNVVRGLNFKVYDFDAYTYTCFGILGCSKNLLGPYRVPDLTPNHYTANYTGITTNGIYVPTNGSFPNMGDGTLVSYTGTITAPITQNHPAGSVYRLNLYGNSDDGFVLKINGQTVINDQSTFQLQSVFGVTSSGWIDIVAGQTYNLEAWYWQDTGGYGMKFYWDYGAGRMLVPNSAFTTGWITETNTVDTSGVAYSNSSIIDMSGSTVSMYPDYVTIGSGTAGTMTFNQTSNITSDQQTKVDLWNNRTITDGNKIYIEQVSGYGNSVTMDQEGNKNLIRAKIEGNSNSITANQGTQGIGQNEIKINTVGDSNTLNINQARTTQGTAIGGNGHYQTVDINGSNNTLTTQQSNTGGVGGHYMETTVNGNQNSITARQTDNSNKIMFTSISGNNNTVEAVQKGTGQHYLENKLTGNNNSVSAVQEGSTANRATLDLTNAGGPASVILQQNGGQNVTVITSCATAGGCAPITVRQGY